MKSMTRPRIARSIRLPTAPPRISAKATELSADARRSRSAPPARLSRRRRASSSRKPRAPTAERREHAERGARIQRVGDVEVVRDQRDLSNSVKCACTKSLITWSSTKTGSVIAPSKSQTGARRCRRGRSLRLAAGSRERLALDRSSRVKRPLPRGIAHPVRSRNRHRSTSSIAALAPRRVTPDQRDQRRVALKRVRRPRRSRTPRGRWLCGQILGASRVG